ncbi:hypothetical protein EHS39_28890 [Ensifer sp. MPMI2T]|nr:hypothetical protein EHS39_28890 [Ensifer sp. MPMI2T]
MDDLSALQALIGDHKAAMERYDNLPDGDVPDDIMAKILATGATLCSYRPMTIEGVHLKAGYMMTCSDFVGGEGGDPVFSHAQLVSGFLPAPTA